MHQNRDNFDQLYTLHNLASKKARKMLKVCEIFKIFSNFSNFFKKRAENGCIPSLSGIFCPPAEISAEKSKKNFFSMKIQTSKKHLLNIFGYSKFVFLESPKHLEHFTWLDGICGAFRWGATVLRKMVVFAIFEKSKHVFCYFSLTNLGSKCAKIRTILINFTHSITWHLRKQGKC